MFLLVCKLYYHCNTSDCRYLDITGQLAIYRPFKLLGMALSIAQYFNEMMSTKISIYRPFKLLGLALSIAQYFTEMMSTKMSTQL